MFNWRNFFEDNRIRYVDKGANISRGEIGIKCPFCADDPSEHMSISLEGKGYICRRNNKHAGRNNAYLVKALLRISQAEANEIVYGHTTRLLSDEDFVTTMRKRLLGEESVKAVSLEIPKGWYPLVDSVPSITKGLISSYIKARGYSQHDVEAMAARYDIHYAMSGPWSRRVIFPIRDEYGRIVNFTGRAIYKKPFIRYKTMRGDKAAVDMSHCLFDYYNLIRTKGKALILCEGPFDAFRMTWIGEPFGIFATCVFTQNVSEVQAEKLIRLASNFERAYVLFDRGAEFHGIRAMFRVGFSRLEMPIYPKVKDPGDLSGSQALALCRTLV